MFWPPNAPNRVNLPEQTKITAVIRAATQSCHPRTVTQHLLPQDGRHRWLPHRTERRDIPSLSRRMHPRTKTCWHLLRSRHPELQRKVSAVKCSLTLPSACSAGPEPPWVGGRSSPGAARGLQAVRAVRAGRRAGQPLAAGAGCAGGTLEPAQGAHNHGSARRAFSSGNETQAHRRQEPAGHREPPGTAQGPSSTATHGLTTIPHGSAASPVPVQPIKKRPGRRYRPQGRAEGTDAASPGHGAKPPGTEPAAAARPAAAAPVGAPGVPGGTEPPAAALPAPLGSVPPRSAPPPPAPGPAAPARPRPAEGRPRGRPRPAGAGRPGGSGGAARYRGPAGPGPGPLTLRAWWGGCPGAG